MRLDNVIHLTLTEGKDLLPVARVAYPGAVIEQDAHGSVRQLETEAIFVRVVDPFGNEERIARHRARVRRNCPQHQLHFNIRPFEKWEKN